MSIVKDSQGNILYQGPAAGIAGLALIGGNFRGASSSSGYPPEADFIGVSFAGCNLANADFSGCNLAGVSFVGANLQNVNFIGSYLSTCDFTDANFLETSFNSSNIYACNFGSTSSRDSTCHFVAANVVDCYSSNRTFLGDFTGIFLTNFNGNNTTLISSEYLDGIQVNNISYCTFNKTITGSSLSGISNCSFGGVQFTGCTFFGAISNTSISGVFFQDCIFDSAPLISCSNGGTSFQRCYLRYGFYSDSNLFGPSFMDMSFRDASPFSNGITIFGISVVDCSFQNTQNIGPVTLQGGSFRRCSFETVYIEQWTFLASVLAESCSFSYVNNGYPTNSSYGLVIQGNRFEGLANCNFPNGTLQDGSTVQTISNTLIGASSGYFPMDSGYDNYKRPGRLINNSILANTRVRATNKAIFEETDLSNSTIIFPDEDNKVTFEGCCMFNAQLLSERGSGGFGVAVDPFDTMREALIFRGCDLRGVSFSGKTFTRVNFLGCDLSFTNMSGATFIECIFQGNNTYQMNTTGRILTSCDYIGNYQRTQTMDLGVPGAIPPSWDMLSPYVGVAGPLQVNLVSGTTYVFRSSVSRLELKSLGGILSRVEDATGSSCRYYEGKDASQVSVLVSGNQDLTFTARTTGAHVLYLTSDGTVTRI
jgi:uncharacterized protein YjbI with pentapeptide repeats